MAKPTAQFSFKANGLSVQFTDGSSGIINSWLWDFGFQLASVEQTSTDQNPAIVFPSAGGYTVSLAVTNNDGTSTFTFPLFVSPTPSLNISIRQMVEYNLPIGLAFDSIGFQQAIQQWELYLQPAAMVSDADVFDETKWPPLYNVLISKLIIMDLVVKSATASMSSYISAAESYNQLVSQTTGGSIYVADYTRSFDGLFPVTINQIQANGVAIGPSGALANQAAMLAWLNGLNIGQFSFTNDGLHLQCFGDPTLLTTFNYTSTGGGNNGAFTQTNARVVSTEITIQTSDTAAGAKGALKSLETGPSKAQWYDSSQYWANIFKAAGPDGGGGGVMTSIQGEICLYAGRLTVKLPGCANDMTLIKPPSVAYRRGRPLRGPWPISNERSGWWDGWL